MTRGGVDFHGWPDRFGFLDSTQALFRPIGGPADDNPAAAGRTVEHLLLVPPKPPVSPLAIEPTDVAAVGLDFGFSPANGDPIEGHDTERVRFLEDGRVQMERFAFNCKAMNQVTDPDGRKRCVQAANQAFVDRIRGINRPTDGKFGPDGAFYLVDFGAVRDFGRATPDSAFRNPADAPLVQIPGTGVIWRISRIDDDRDDD